MPSIEPGIFDHLIFLVLVAFIPWDGRRRFQSLVAAVEAGRPNARTNAYRRVMLEEWILTATIAIGWIVLSRGAATLGLVPQMTTPAMIGYGLTILAIGVLLVQSRSIAKSEKNRQDARKVLTPLAALMPHTRSEKRLFGVVSITAGVCEEFIYRGFLFAYLAGWMPGQSTWLVVVLAGALFGLAHLYQGGSGILKTGGLGVLLGGLYWLTGSLWAPMLLHAVIDLNSGWIGWRVMQDEATEGGPVPAAA